MLTPRQIEEAADTLVPIWDELKEWITLDLIDRIMARLGNDDISLSRSELWRVEVFKDAGGLLDELQARIKRALGISDNELRRVFIDCGAKAAANDSAVYAHNTAPAAAQAHERARSEELLSADYRAPEGRTGSRNEKQQKRPLENISERMRDIMNDAYTRTSGELRNFTGTTADSVQVQFIRELDRAYLKVASGACSQWQAAQEAVDSIIDQQGTVTYPSGHVDTIEVAVIRAIRTGISRMSGALAIESALEHGLNHVLVSSHLGARVGSGEPGHDNHAWWQGKIYTIEGSSDKYPNLEQATGYPTDPRGLCGYNCRHNMQPFDPEVMINNTRQYDEEENEEAYNASQEMRRMERRLRKQSTAVKALERAEDICRDEKLKESFRYDRELAEKRYEELKRSYLDYCSGHGVRPSYERLFTAKDRAGKTDNSSGGISTSVSVANSGNGGIIRVSGAISGALNPDSKEAQDHADQYYESVRHMTNDVNRIAKNTGFSADLIFQIKDFIFMQKHDLGGKELEYFYPSYEMAQSWQRLIEGKNIQPHDLTLLNHEKMERELMAQGYSQNEAHDITSRVYNYGDESREYYANINKHSKNR